MKMKRTIKQIVSGVLAAATVFSAVMSPMDAYAAETDPGKQKPPAYEEVKDQLDGDEVVTAHDYTVEAGSDFDVTCDFTGIDIIDDDKVGVTFQEAKNTEGEDFSTDHEDTYRAVYYVEPKTTDHSTYQISRNLVVKDMEAASQVMETGAESRDDGQTEEAEDDGEDDSQTESQQPQLSQAETQTDRVRCAFAAWKCGRPEVLVVVWV